MIFSFVFMLVFENIGTNLLNMMSNVLCLSVEGGGSYVMDLLMEKSFSTCNKIGAASDKFDLYKHLTLTVQGPSIILY